MYESESNTKVESRNQIPSDVLEQFEQTNPDIVSRTLLNWGEHCTECAIPGCYKTCDLYEARPDGKCRRFIDGMIRIKRVNGFNPYLLKIQFKRWAQLFTWSNGRLLSLKEVRLREYVDLSSSACINKIPLPPWLRLKFTRLRIWQKFRLSTKLKNKGQLPSYFLLECYNPQKEVIKLSFSVLPILVGSLPFYETLIHLEPGFTRIRIPVADISQFINLKEKFKMRMIPNEVPDGTTLIFGTMDFVRDVQFAPATATKCKCVVWDLDGTLWDGILIEDGPENLKLKEGITDIIKELDQRGILHSIASKNNENDAMEVIKRFGLDAYFLHPQISWSPKAQAVHTIAKNLNIGLNTLMLVDDSEFERAEVKHVYPEMRVIDARDYRSLLNMDPCRVEVTSVSKDRRKMYMAEAVRESTHRDFEGDYIRFLRECNIQLEISPMTRQDLQRVHELTQRTNQMNFSGNRYDGEILKNILANQDLHTYVMRCKDRFGSYGTIGFAIVDSRKTVMTDLMFSCRIQSKRVEHAFLTFALKLYTKKKDEDFYVTYRKTERNVQSGKVFDDFQFEQLNETDGVSTLVFRKNRKVPDDGIIDVTVSKGAAT